MAESNTIFNFVVATLLKTGQKYGKSDVIVTLS